DDHEIGPVGLDAIILQGDDLVARRGQPHDAVAVHLAGIGIHVAARQPEVELGLESHLSLRTESRNKKGGPALVRAGPPYTSRYRSAITPCRSRSSSPRNTARP